MACGVLAASLVVGCSGEPDPAGQAPTPTTATSTVTAPVSTPTPPAGGPALATGLAYAERRFSSAWLEAPKAWPFRETGDGKAQAIGNAGPWRLDIEVLPGATRKQESDLNDRLTKLRGTPGLRVSGKAPGVLRFEDGDRDYTTLTYTYRSSDGTRLVLSRWLEVTSVPDARVSHAELTVTGRPQDSTGLQAVLTRATVTLTLDE